MPYYPYRDEAGNGFEVYANMGEAPGTIGEWVEFDGFKAQRLPPQLQPATVKKHMRETRNLPKWYPFHRKAGGSFGPNGECRFESMAQVKETMAVANHHGEEVVWDD